MRLSQMQPDYNSSAKNSTSRPDSELTIAIFSNVVSFMKSRKKSELKNISKKNPEILWISPVQLSMFWKIDMHSKQIPSLLQL